MAFIPSIRLTRPQRIIVSIYLVCLAYCLCWIPWLATRSNRYGNETQRLGYGWVWAGPRYPRSLLRTEARTQTPSVDDFDQFVAVEEARQQWNVTSSHAAPDLRLILVRLSALSAAASALLVAAGLFTGNAKAPPGH